jgi:D-arabinose 5-phosphate isomerase GutQ
MNITDEPVSVVVFLCRMRCVSFRCGEEMLMRHSKTRKAVTHIVLGICAMDKVGLTILNFLIYHFLESTIETNERNYCTFGPDDL